MSHEESIQEVVTELLKKMGFAPTVSVEKSGISGEEAYSCKIVLEEDQNFLIGQYGMNLAAILHLVRILVRRKTGEKLNVIVDVNDYFSEKKQILEKEAERALLEVREKKSNVALRPMQSYERKIVHSYLASHTDVVTESVGEGAERKITIRPAA